MLKRLWPYAVIFLAVQTVLRLSLLARAMLEVEFSASAFAAAIARGVWLDLATASFCLLPILLYFFFLPASRQGGAGDRRTDMALRFIFSFILLFDAVAEHLFWSEFTTRFNFIAVDYLIYTQEVIGNIVESYPLGIFIGAIAMMAVFITWLSMKISPPVAQPSWPRFSRRLRVAAVWCAACVALYHASSTEQAEIRDNAEATEAAANGIYNLFAAFWSNEISYSRFYAMQPEESVARHARVLLKEKGQAFLHDDGKDLTRRIDAKGAERHKNVVIVVMESMSADYMAAFGNKQGITPNLDRLASEGLFFTDLYATGTRTVRGLEAVTLSIPPTPGQSIIRRPGNENLFSLGFVFKDRGYETQFLYGGYGYFDNMNAFFAGNGFDVIDRTAMREDEVQFANVWGICDEDMFARAIKEADRAQANKKPFMQLIMTTSNHRPYTYPEGHIEIASKSGRLGGVKYADYSIGRLIEEAKKKPWFKDTVFVFVADHTAGAGGKAELDPHKYHIPMIFYAPGMVAPRRYEYTASQIDMAPVLLGLLHFSYYTKFFGEDLLQDEDEIPHAFISNYQKVALVRQGELTVLEPKQRVKEYRWPSVEANEGVSALIEDTITYYQSASWWKEQYRRVPTVYKKSP